jgi:hypothetical protein
MKHVLHRTSMSRYGHLNVIFVSFALTLPLPLFHLMNVVMNNGVGSIDRIIGSFCNHIPSIIHCFIIRAFIFLIKHVNNNNCIDLINTTATIGTTISATSTSMCIILYLLWCSSWSPDWCICYMG